MRLSDLLTPERIRIPLEATAKEDVLRELVSLLPSATDGKTRDRILESVLEREERMSTGIGQGVAIPHGKSDQVTEMEMAFGLTARPIDFQALDGEACRVFFLLVSPPGMTGPHIRALAQVSRVLISHSVRDELAGAQNAEEVRALLRREESLENDDED